MKYFILLRLIYRSPLPTGNGANLRINLMNIEHRTRNNECRSS